MEIEMEIEIKMEIGIEMEIKIAIDALVAHCAVGLALRATSVFAATPTKVSRGKLRESCAMQGPPRAPTRPLRIQDRQPPSSDNCVLPIGDVAWAASNRFAGHCGTFQAFGTNLSATLLHCTTVLENAVQKEATFVISWHASGNSLLCGSKITSEVAVLYEDSVSIPSSNGHLITAGMWSNIAWLATADAEVKAFANF